MARSSAAPFSVPVALAMAEWKGFGLDEEIDESWLLTDDCDMKGGVGRGLWGGAYVPLITSLWEALLDWMLNLN